MVRLIRYLSHMEKYSKNFLAIKSFSDTETANTTSKRFALKATKKVLCKKYNKICSDTQSISLSVFSKEKRS